MQRDWQWRAALLAAPALWLLLYIGAQPDIQPNWPISRPWTFIMLAVVYPVVEELGFRGLIQGWLAEKTMGKSIGAGISQANLLTSVLFSLLHTFTHTTLMAASVMLPSLIFGYFRDKYNGWLLPSIALHCLYNAGYFLIFEPAVG